MTAERPVQRRLGPDEWPAVRAKIQEVVDERDRARAELQRIQARLDAVADEAMDVDGASGPQVASALGVTVQTLYGRRAKTKRA